MLRLLSHILCALSAALFLALLILWPLRYSVGRAIGYRESNWTAAGWRQQIYAVCSGSGHIRLTLMYDLEPGLTREHFSHSSPEAQARFEKVVHDNPPESRFFAGSIAGGASLPRPGRLGFDWQHSAPGQLCEDLFAPIWFLLLLCALWPARYLDLYRRQRRRRAAGLCASCGYDLRAHSPGQRCPECGTVISESPTDSSPPMRHR